MATDRVNRFQNTVVLSVATAAPVGSAVTLSDLQEQTLDPDVKDPMLMQSPRVGNAVGDAVVDANEATDAFDADAM